MCGVNHNLFPKPGYLIDVASESIAAKVLFTRMLNHRAEIGLSDTQVAGLLDLNAEYQAQLVEIRMQFAKVTEQLEHKRGRLNAATIAERKVLIDEHADLLRAEELLFFEFGARGHDLLTDEQIARIDAMYHAEKDAALANLLQSLNNAVGPAYQFGLVPQ